jgi:hypothetical protein
MNYFYPLVMGLEGSRTELATLSMDRSELLRYVASLTYLSTSVTNTGGTLRMSLLDGSLFTIKAVGNELGVGDIEINLDGSGDFDYGVGAKWFKESLVNCKGDEVRFSLIEFTTNEGKRTNPQFHLTDGDTEHSMLVREF